MPSVLLALRTEVSAAWVHVREWAIEAEFRLPLAQWPEMRRRSRSLDNGYHCGGGDID